ncbi:MAG: CPXCG motif-containing cysteine-rich protein [Gammaproteobacteria bacterium]|nr:CPXCG motif-containing cysteine-rich protein [Gammaproteobacteria bacterium]
MNQQEYYEVSCPYCGEYTALFIDCSVTEQTLIEDCQVCCRPISYQVLINDSNEISVSVRHENE